MSGCDRCGTPAKRRVRCGKCDRLICLRCRVRFGLSWCVDSYGKIPQDCRDAEKRNRPRKECSCRKPARSGSHPDPECRKCNGSGYAPAPATADAEGEK